MRKIITKVVKKVEQKQKNFQFPSILTIIWLEDCSNVPPAHQRHQTSRHTLVQSLTYNIRHLIVPNSVTTIGNQAFYDVRHIEYHGTAEGAPWYALSMNGLVDGDFAYCDEVTSVSLPEGVSIVENGAFLGCTQLQSVSLPSTLETILATTSRPSRWPAPRLPPYLKHASRPTMPPSTFPSAPLTPIASIPSGVSSPTSSRAAQQESARQWPMPSRTVR